MAGWIRVGDRAYPVDGMHVEAYSAEAVRLEWTGDAGAAVVTADFDAVLAAVDQAGRTGGVVTVGEAAPKPGLHPTARAFLRAQKRVSAGEEHGQSEAYVARVDAVWEWIQAGYPGAEDEPEEGKA